MNCGADLLPVLFIGAGATGEREKERERPGEGKRKRERKKTKRVWKKIEYVYTKRVNVKFFNSALKMGRERPFEE